MKGEPPLFPEEMQLIRELLPKGASYREVARQLDRDPSTVRNNALRVGLRSVHPCPRKRP